MTTYVDCPDKRFGIEWRTAREYDCRDAAGDTTIYKHISDPYLFSAGDMALHWYFIFYARVSGDL